MSSNCLRFFLRHPFNSIPCSSISAGRKHFPKNLVFSPAPLFQKFLRTYSSLMESKKTKSKVAVSQMTVTADKGKNFEICRQLIEDAAKCGAEMIFLPEACDYIAESNTQSLEMAEDIEGPLISNFRQLARTHNIWISIGGFHYKCPGGEKMFNTHLVVSSNGDIKGRYDKIHLFDVELPDKKIKLKESDYIQHGKAVAEPVDSPVGKIGLGICYDLRFPEFSLSLAHKGAQVLTYPSAFTVPTGMAHWESLLRCRAIETQCYVVAAAQTGVHNVKRSSYGHAMIIDPWGTILAQCGEGTSIALATVDLEYLSKIRREMPVLAHRKPNLYQPMRMIGDNPVQPTDEEIFTFGQVSVRGCMVFYRSRLSVAFVNKKCVVPGHVLVIPIRLAPRFVDLQPDEVADLFQTARHVQRGMELLHNVTSSTLTIQDGPDAGQTINHVHVHILPRRPGDFKRNDDIYHHLERHDQGIEVQWREEHEMEQEARQLRDFFGSLTQRETDHSSG